jgi:hypothetical protein
MTIWGSKVIAKSWLDGFKTVIAIHDQYTAGLQHSQALYMQCSGFKVLEVDSATSVDMTYNGIGVISGFALKGVAPFCIHPQTFVPHHV